MAVDDLWYLKERGSDGARLKSARHGRGKRFRCRYTDPAGNPKERLFDRKVDADRHDVNTRADMSRGRYVDPDAGRITVSAYTQQWRATLLHRGSTAARVEQAVRLHIEPTLGRLQLAQVRPSHIQSWVKDRATVLAPSTLRLVYGYVSSLFAAATLDRVIATSPCQRIQLPDLDESDRFIPLPEQVHAVADALPERYSALVYLAAGCSHRLSEAFAVELEHVNFLRREISIVQQMMQEPDREPFLAPVKTPKSKRTVEMGQVVAEALARHIERFPPTLVEIDDETDPRKPVRRQAKLLFVNGDGVPIRRTSWYRPWAPAVKVAGMPPGFDFHALRHYHATLLIHGGASVKTVQLALGHSKPSITLDMYTHDWPDAVDRTRNLVDAALSRSSGTDWAQTSLRNNA